MAHLTPAGRTRCNCVSASIYSCLFPWALSACADANFASGLQLEMSVEIGPATEIEYCQFFQTGDAELLVNRDEIYLTRGGHHLLLWTTPYSQIPTHNDFGEPVDTSRPFDCSEGVPNGWTGTGIIAGSQSFEGDSFLALPKGVAIRLPPGSVVLANVHYVNPTEAVLPTSAQVTLHAIPEHELEEEGGFLLFYNTFLKVPAHGESRMTASCPIPEDIVLTNAQSHMHARGVGFDAVLEARDGTRETIYESSTWQDVPVQRWTPGLDVVAGSRIEWSCEYANDGALADRPVYQGLRSTDEMCMFIGSYYPRNDRLGFCRSGDTFATRWLAARWSLGTGTATCAQSLACVGRGVEKGAAAPTAVITDCLIASSPSVAEPLSRAIACLTEAGFAANSCSAEVDACSTQ